MNFKKTITIIILSFLVQIAWSQNEKDEIILNSGKSIKGKIISQKPGEYIKIVRYNLTDTIIVKMEEIDEMKKIDQKAEPIIELIDPRIEGYNTPYDTNLTKTFSKHNFSFYILASLGENGIGGIFGQGLGLSFQRVIHDKLNLGISFGVYFNDLTKDMIAFIPFTLDARIRLEEVKSQKLDYFLRTSIGYSSILINDNFYFSKNMTTNTLTDGGLVIKLGLGLEKTNTRSKKVSIEFGFLYQRFYHQDDNNKFPERVIDRGRFYIQPSFFF